MLPLENDLHKVHCNSLAQAEKLLKWQGSYEYLQIKRLTLFFRFTKQTYLPDMQGTVIIMPRGG